MARTIVVLCLFLTFTCFVSAGFVSVGNAKYFISETKVNWFEANRICKAEYGMVLVDIVNENDNAQIMEVIKPRMGSSDTGFWTSGTDLGSEGIFYWSSSGHSMLFNDFDANQPDNFENKENCVHLSRDYSYKWNDVDCNSLFYFICRNTVSYPLNNCICLNS